MRQTLQRAATDPRLSDYQRDKALARLRDIARIEDAVAKSPHPDQKNAEPGTPQIIPLLVYVLAPSIFFCFIGAIVPAIIVFGDAGWAWLIHDRVIAIVVFERGIMNVEPLTEIVLGGVAIGLLLSIGMIAYRWINGYWPHQS